ncbi:CvfB family protein [Pontiella agarivorans]|uniref:S1-like domain-containing RNA-binding protein n=1 Tax=Pontiella agarivorans TaxID=3038953 RepID=A0ABU5N1F8_9BACT|nr:S1-like domain-containing RNA-binding protein [Pontiella agarivorans]MDZ8120262.1 S1-like domain-containing RNA-binding protein [Pontiella agarivorans]
MVEVGKWNKLAISRETDFGLVFDGLQLGEILMPNRYVSKAWNLGDKIEVFVYLDSEDRLTATTQKPKAQVGEFALLRCKDATPIGAFLDWGLPKDLFVPFREQRMKMRKGESYLVYLYYDKASERIVASAKLDKYLNSKRFYKNNEEVDLMVWQKSDLGYKFIINNERWGMVFHNEIFQALERGTRIKGYIKNVRPDGRIDLTLQKQGYEKVTDLTDVILEHLKKNDGFMPVTSKTSPEKINALFGVSKKTYKNAVGALYKKRLITIEDDGVRLV